MAGGVSFGSGKDQQPSPSLDAAIRDLSIQLDKLVRELEVEVRETGQISSDSAEGLRELRLSFQRLFGRSG